MCVSWLWYSGSYLLEGCRWTLPRREESRLVFMSSTFERGMDDDCSSVDFFFFTDAVMRSSISWFAFFCSSKMLNDGYG